MRNLVGVISGQTWRSSKIKQINGWRKSLASVVKHREENTLANHHCR